MHICYFILRLLLIVFGTFSQGSLRDLRVLSNRSTRNVLLQLTLRCHYANCNHPISILLRSTFFSNLEAQYTLLGTKNRISCAANTCLAKPDIHLFYRLKSKFGCSELHKRVKKF